MGLLPDFIAKPKSRGLNLWLGYGSSLRDCEGKLLEGQIQRAACRAG